MTKSDLYTCSMNQDGYSGNEMMQSRITLNLKHRNQWSYRRMSED
ncbi:hypothetical protein [Tenacibaculum sp.]